MKCALFLCIKANNMKNILSTAKIQMFESTVVLWKRGITFIF